jgi:tryptophan synthase alpha chain
MPAVPRSIAQSFAALRGKGIGLVPFVPAGFPDLAATPQVIRAMDRAGVTAIEIGFPFSDPIADGPTIQQAFTAALARKLKIADIFESVKAPAREISAPLLAMVSYSLIFRYGPDRFLADARSAGFAGLIIPDLPPPQAQETCEKIRAAGLDTVLLIAPTTAPQRRQQIVGLCSGFVYYISISGITGARTDLPPDLTENIRQLKSLTDRPICVGFGISTRQHMIALNNIADGAIVGSAIVKRMTDSAASGPQAIAQTVQQYCQELLGTDR